MPNPLVVQHYPDDFRFITLNLNTTADGADQAMFYADRTLVIDSVHVGTSTADSSAALVLKYASSPVPATIAAGTAITSSMDISAVGTVGGNSVVLSTANEVPAGNWIGCDFTSAAESFKGVVQIRFRSRVA